MGELKDVASKRSSGAFGRRMAGHLRTVAAIAVGSVIFGIVVAFFSNMFLGFLATIGCFVLAMYLWISPND
jgi:hypothetical protein